jgi:hypothetical protein
MVVAGGFGLWGSLFVWSFVVASLAVFQLVWMVVVIICF